MKTKLLVLFLLFSSLGLSLNAQCTPNTTPCTAGAAVAPFGGLCDTVIPNAIVGTPYLGVLQFYISGICFDPTVLGVSVPIPGVTARISAINSVGFSQLPNGISSGTDQASYNIPFNATRLGCGYFAGTPTQAGVFGAQVAISGSYTTANCYFFTTTGTETINYTIDFTVLPNANFSGLAASYCANGGPVTLSPTGTTGGTFSGPGVSGNTFNPASAGVGTHTITYTVSAQEGSAIAPATNSSSQQVVVSAANTYYADTDNDNFGNPANSIVVCSSTPPAGYVANNLDCNDGNSNINPNGTEICDNLDNNCNAQIDENLTLFTYYRDFDNDGFGDASNSIDTCLSSPPAGYLVDSTDCNDALASINPNATDIPGNGIDEDCNGSDATLVVDNDFDGFDNTVDCNDNNSAIFPGATEICDGVDNNCDGNIDEGLTLFTYYLDSDNDGFGTANSSISSCASVAPNGYSDNDLDCNDNNMNINPNASEVCDGVDNDCDGLADNGLPLNTYYLDADFDGFGTSDSSISICNANAPAGYSANSLDCNDGDININPNATEVCDGEDNNCDGFIDEGLSLFSYFRDADNDGYGDANDELQTCASSAPQGYVANALDCNDGNGNINPAAVEVCDGVDNDCDGVADDSLTVNTFYEDLDGDGFGGTNAATISSCSSNPPSGYSTTADDCDDNNDGIYPGAIEIDDDGIDQDCNPATGLRKEQSVQMLVFPNPSTGVVKVELQNAKEFNLSLMSIDGQNILLEYTQDSNGFYFDISQLSKGIYLLKVQDSKGNFAVERLVKE